MSDYKSREFKILRKKLAIHIAITVCKQDAFKLVRITLFAHTEKAETATQIPSHVPREATALSEIKIIF
ncbi:MAG: hypothetical protein C0618_01425 [Desulfuromonas sp.]|nr:MAG: hypothetical protein C0618_01425 [Desulfuromonas sp.]